MKGASPWRDRVEAATAQFVVIVFVAFALYPVLWVLSVALSGNGLASQSAILPVPRNVTLDNFRAVVGEGRAGGIALFAAQFTSSIVVSIGTALVGVMVATPAAYALARFEFFGSRYAERGLLATQMFPAVASAVPLYLILDALHLLDTRSGLILVYASTAVPFAIFQLRGAFQTIPIDLEEAAMVDGATRFQAFVRVVLPAARPAIAVTALFCFMSAWNEFILAATFLSRESAFTLPVVLQRYVGEHDAAWGPFAAGAILVSAPVMIFFYLVQKQLVAGLTAGGVKG